MNILAFSTSKAASREAAPYHLTAVGGDIVGRACALRLAQIGLRIAHIALPAPAPIPARPDTRDARIYALSSSSQTLLEQSRIWPALGMVRVQPVRDMQIFSDDAAARGEHAHPDLHFSVHAAGTPQLAWIAESSFVGRALETALRSAHTAQSSPHVVTDFGMEADAVKLMLADRQAIRAECVIGADDKHSRVREQADIQAEAKPYRQLGVVANFQAEHWYQDIAWQQFLGASTEQAVVPDDGPPVRDRILAMLSLPGRRVSMARSVSGDHARELLALSPEALCRAVGVVAGDVVVTRFGRLSNIMPAQGFPLVLQYASRVAVLRVALVGDAVCVTHLLAGQGTNLRFRDVSEIGRVMTERETMCDHGDLGLLRRHERAHREDLPSLTAATDGLHKLLALPGTLSRTVCSAGICMVGMTPFIRRLLIKYALG